MTLEDLAEKLVPYAAAGSNKYEVLMVLHGLRAEGLAVVPREATGEMVIEGGEAQQQSIGSWGEPGVVWRAAIAAGEIKPEEGK